MAFHNEINNKKNNNITFETKLLKKSLLRRLDVSAYK
jgi:hypothetical protein